jgi:hypothetical protein
VLGSVFRMDEWMEENGVSAADDEFVGRSRGANARRPQARCGSPAPSSEASAKRSQKEGLRPLQGMGKDPGLLKGRLGQALMSFSARVSSKNLSQFESIFWAMASSSARFWRATSAVSVSPAFSARRSSSW